MTFTDSTLPLDRPPARSLLRWGLVAGPFFLTLGLAQAFVRDGFDLGRHPLSVLANGPGGWVQTVNFALTGVMVMAAAVGFKRALGSSARATTWCLGVYGLSVFLAAVFPADPVDGFPPGTPEGPPTSISTIGLLHFIVGALGFLSLAISALTATRPMMRRGLGWLGWFSLFTGLSVVVGFFGGIALPIGVAGIWFAVVIGWVWLAAMSYSLSQTV
ncbi:MAG: DUF998 domain-containing protein [Acidobacteria bacterium]|nr:DUF998 domain-containing protein [Acidobacteriota bacterium]